MNAGRRLKQARYQATSQGRARIETCRLMRTLMARRSIARGSGHASQFVNRLWDMDSRGKVTICFNDKIDQKE